MTPTTPPSQCQMVHFSRLYCLKMSHVFHIILCGTVIFLLPPVIRAYAYVCISSIFFKPLSHRSLRFHPKDFIASPNSLSELIPCFTLLKYLSLSKSTLPLLLRELHQIHVNTCILSHNGISTVTPPPACRSPYLRRAHSASNLTRLWIMSTTISRYSFVAILWCFLWPCPLSIVYFLLLGSLHTCLCT
jgi:hypothetical protein